MVKKKKRVGYEREGKAKLEEDKVIKGKELYERKDYVKEGKAGRKTSEIIQKVRKFIGKEGKERKE